MNFVSRIATPTLCLSAEDDAFLPPSVLLEVRRQVSSSVELRTTAHGGHIGFIAGRVPWRPIYWAENLVVEWLTRQAG